MIRSSASLMAEDVTIRCRVRRTAHNGSNSSLTGSPTKPIIAEEGYEMTCTMRNWESIRTNRSTFAKTFHTGNDTSKFVQGPELLLTQIEEYITNRDDSPVRRRTSLRNNNYNNNNNLRPRAAQYSIPLSDIMMVYTFPFHKGTRYFKLNITTLSLGFFEFDQLNTNGHDILLAFLEASLPNERIVDGGSPDVGCDIHSKASISSCLDIDTLQAQHLKGRAERETWPEKFTRRMGHVVNSLSELSDALCEVACCRERPPDHHREETRDMPPSPRRSVFDKLEIDDSSTAMSSMKQRTPKRSTEYSSICRLPTGLSVEPDPEMESTYHHQ